MHCAQSFLISAVEQQLNSTFSEQQRTLRRSIKDTVTEVVKHEVKHEVTASFAAYKLALPKAVETAISDKIKLKDVIKDTVAKSVWSEVASLIQDKKQMLTVRERNIYLIVYFHESSSYRMASIKNKIRNYKC